jgi:hypothetical protein
VQRIGWCEDSVWLDAGRAKQDETPARGSIGFHGVSQAVWRFRIGGYQVCEKWLKDRKGRNLNVDDIKQYRRIIDALGETIRIMGVIDDAINAHGGWPGAFQHETPALSSPPSLRKVAEAPHDQYAIGE